MCFPLTLCNTRIGFDRHSPSQTIQRRLSALARSLTQTAKIVKAVHPLTFSQSMHLEQSVEYLQKEFVDLLATTVAAKKIFKTIPFNIDPLVATGLKALGSAADSLEAELEAIVVGPIKNDVVTSRKVIATAFSDAVAAYSN